jgi:hypothetical protein
MSERIALVALATAELKRLGSGGGGPSPQHWPFAANDLLSKGQE